MSDNLIDSNKAAAGAVNQSFIDNTPIKSVKETSKQLELLGNSIFFSKDAHVLSDISRANHTSKEFKTKKPSHNSASESIKAKFVSAFTFLKKHIPLESIKNIHLFEKVKQVGYLIDHQVSKLIMKAKEYLQEKKAAPAAHQETKTQTSENSKATAAKEPKPAPSLAPQIVSIKSDLSGDAQRAILGKLTEYLRKHSHVQGIFRHSGSETEKRKWKEALLNADRREKALESIDEESDPHVIACLFKELIGDWDLLKDTENPEECSPLETELLKIASMPNDHVKKEAIRNWLSRLNEDQRSIYKELFKIAHEVSGKSDVNNMTPENLGIVLGPRFCDLKRFPSDKQITETNNINQLFSYILSNYSEFFESEEKELPANEATIEMQEMGEQKAGQDQGPELPEDSPSLQSNGMISEVPADEPDAVQLRKAYFISKFITVGAAAMERYSDKVQMTNRKRPPAPKKEKESEILFRVEQLSRFSGEDLKKEIRKLSKEEIKDIIGLMLMNYVHKAHDGMFDEQDFLAMEPALFQLKRVDGKIK